MLRANLALVV